MGRITRNFLWASLIIALTGCTGASRELWLKSQSERKDVFSESRELAPPGMTKLHIRASVKVKLEKHFVRGSDIAKRGYPFLLNIDGQAVIWRVFGQREWDGNTSFEEGEGFRYILERKLTLTPGLHTIFFGLPEDRIFVQFDVGTEEGKAYVVEFKPSYGVCLTGHKEFTHGVNGLEIFLNGNPISPEKRS